MCMRVCDEEREEKIKKTAASVSACWCHFGIKIGSESSDVGASVRISKK